MIVGYEVEEDLEVLKVEFLEVGEVMMFKI